MTQEKQRNKFWQLLDQISKDIDAINADTPWSILEPDWWLIMMELQRDIIKKRDAIKKIDTTKTG